MDNQVSFNPSLHIKQGHNDALQRSQYVAGHFSDVLKKMYDNRDDNKAIKEAEEAYKQVLREDKELIEDGSYMTDEEDEIPREKMKQLLKSKIKDLLHFERNHYGI